MSIERKRRRTQAERTQASDKAIYKAAIKLIAEDGPQNMSLAKLGRVAGFSGGLISYRFGTKSNLLKAIADRIFELWQRRVLEPALLDESALDDLKTLGMVYLDSVKTKSDLIMALFRLMNDSYSTHKELKTQFSEYDNNARNVIINLLEKGIESGEIKNSINPRGVSVFFIAILRGAALQYFIDESKVDLEQIGSMIADMLDGLEA